MPVKRASMKSESRRVFGRPSKPPKTALRAGLYARVSTNDQQTLPMQLRALREYAAWRGWLVISQVKEVGSGASQRQMRENLMAAAGRREIDVVLVWRLDRWGRSVADLLLATLEGTGASRRGLRVAHRSSRSDFACRPRHGRAAGCVRRVRTGGPSRARSRRSCPCPAKRQAPGPSPHGRSQSRSSPGGGEAETD